MDMWGKMMKISFRRLLSAFLAVVMIVVTILPTSVVSSAYEGTPIDGNDPASGFHIAGSDSDGVSVLINGKDINTLSDNSEIKNGDKLDLFFRWHLDDGKVGASEAFTVTYDLAPYMNGIVLKEGKYDTVDDGSTKANYYIQDQKLIIEVENHLSSNIVGTGKIEGTLNSDKASDLDNGKFGFKYFDTVKPLIFGDKIPKLDALKTVGELRFDGADYYQDYTVKIANGGNVDAENVVLKDIFTGAGSLFGDKIDMVTVKQTDGTSTNYYDIHSGDPIDIGTVAKETNVWHGGCVEVTYSLKVDSDAAVNKTYAAGAEKNSVTVEDDKGNKKDAEATVTYAPPALSKTGTYNGSVPDPKIEWKITVNPGFYKAKDTLDFSVSDTPDSNLSAADIAAAINAVHAGAASVSGGSVQISRDAFTKNADGTYTLTYITDVPSSLAEAETKTTINNSADATIEGYNPPTANGSADVGGNIALEANKSVKSVDGDRITWQIEVTIPDAAGTLSNLVVKDNTDIWYDNGKTHTIEDYSTDFKVNGSSSFTDIGSFLGGPEDWRTDEKDKNYFNFYISDTYANAHKGEKIVIEVVTTMQDEHSYNYYNKIDYSVKIDSTNLSKTADAVYTADLSAVKSGSISYDYGKLNPIDWKIVLKASNAHIFSADDVIDLDDLLPEGYAIYGDAQFSIENEWSARTNIAVSTSMSGDRQKISGKITLTAEQAAAVNASHTIYVFYKTSMTPEYAAEFEKKPDGKYPFTNDAEIKVNSTSVDKVSATVEIETNPKNIIGKSITSQGKDAGDGKWYADYSVEINKNALTLAGGSTLNVKDTLGSRLTLVGDITVTPSDVVSAPVYDAAANTISVGLKDSTAYTISYRVEVKQIYKNDAVSDEKITEFFGNTIEIEGAGSDYKPSKVVINESTYRSSFDASSDDASKKITLSGEKTWTDSGKEGLRPKKVVITLKKERYDEGAVTPSSTTYPTYDVVLDTETGHWSYTINNLIVKDAQNATYKYEVYEVLVDGYKANYTYEGGTETTEHIKDISGSGGEVRNLIIRNEFVADKEEVGSVRVNKIWDNDDGKTELRSSVTFEIFDMSGAEPVSKGSKTLSVGETYVTFDNLPIYNYKRLADDTLERTPIEYKVVETGLGSNYTTDAPKTVKLADDGSVIGAPAVPIVKNVDVTNTYNVVDEYIKIKVNKQFSDTGYEALRPAKISVILTQFKDTGAGFGAGTDMSPIDITVTGSSFSHTTDQLIVKDKYGVKYKYTLKEAVIDGYTVKLRCPARSITSDVEISDITGSADEIVKIDIENKFTPEKGSLSVKKIWQGDDDNSGGTRKDIKFSLYDTSVVPAKLFGEKTLVNGGGSDNVLFTDVPLFSYTRDSDGNIVRTPLEYKLTESDLPGYVSDIPASIKLVADGTVPVSPVTKNVDVTNTYSDENTYISISGSKYWADTGYAFLRPANISIVLTKKTYESGTLTDTEELAPVTVPVTSLGDTFTYSIDNLIVKDNVGKTYKYDFKEISIDGCTTKYYLDGAEKASITDITGAGGENVKVDIRNILDLDEKGSLQVDKTWLGDDGNSANTRTSIIFTLYDNKNSSVIGYKALAADASPANVKFENLAVFTYSRNADGNIVRTPKEYRIAESEITGYSALLPAAFTLTDAAVPLLSPASKTVEVKNTYYDTPGEEHISINIEKVWDDAGNESLRPESVSVVLTQNKYVGGVLESSTDLPPVVIPVTSTEIAFSETVTGLITRDKFGAEYKYDVKEVLIEGCTAKYYLNGVEKSAIIDVTGIKGQVINVGIKNTFVPEKGSLKITKTWQNDDNNLHNTRTDLTFSLYEDGTLVKTETLPVGQTVLEFSDLPIFTYGRAADGTLERTVKTYKLTESGAGANYTVIIPPSIKLVSSAAAPALPVNKNVEVINRYKVPETSGGYRPVIPTTTPAVTTTAPVTTTPTETTVPDTKPEKTTSTTASVTSPEITTTTTVPTDESPTVTDEADVPEDEVEIDVGELVDENPNTGTKLPSLFAAIFFGVIAAIPARKKKND